MKLRLKPLLVDVFSFGRWHYGFQINILSIITERGFRGLFYLDKEGEKYIIDILFLRLRDDYKKH